jgi:hypothetical protein
MFIQPANIKKLFLLGTAVASTKIMLLLFAYFFDAETYNLFNQVYYTASIVILFSSLGFNIAITRINISLKLVAFAVIVNSLLVYIVLHIISAPLVDITEIIPVLIYSIFISIGGICVFHLLFTGKYKDFVMLTLVYSFLHLMIIPAMLFLNLSLFTIMPAVSILWFIAGYPKYIKQEGRQPERIKELYRIGLSAFIINSAVSLALAADKYFVNYYFAPDTANSYTFAWGITAPMFYIGVIIERFLYSELNVSRNSILRRGFVLSTTFVFMYAAVVLALVNFIPSLIPASVSYDYVVKISTMMITGYSFYIVLHFPVNAYLFKALDTGKHNAVSRAFRIVILIFLLVYAFMIQGTFSVDYVWLLIVTWAYIFTLLITKIFIMFREDIGEAKVKPLIEIKDLES